MSPDSPEKPVVGVVILKLFLSAQAEIPRVTCGPPREVKGARAQQLPHIRNALLVRWLVAQRQKLNGRDLEHLRLTDLADGETAGHHYQVVNESCSWVLERKHVKGYWCTKMVIIHKNGNHNIVQTLPIFCFKQRWIAIALTIMSLDSSSLILTRHNITESGLDIVVFVLC